MAVPEGTITDVLAWVDDDPTRAQEALDAERAGQNRTTLVTQLESIANKEATVSDTTTAEPEEVEEVPGPVPPSGDELAVDLYDRSTVVGPANLAHDEVDKPEDSYDLVKAEDHEPGDESIIDAAAVEFFQVASNNGVVVVRFDGNAVLLDTQQALALVRDLRGALANVTY